MSGHSKWHSIRHQKGVADARRGKLFTKLTREIIVAVKQGGSNPDMNSRLRLAVQRARDSRMPSDNIERAIKRGSGDLGGASLIEMVLEGYGPHGVAILIKALTDNRNRTVQEIRNIFTRSGGNLGESGSVAWLFDSRGLILLETGSLDADEIALQSIDAGADDIKSEGDYMEIYTKPEELELVREKLEVGNITISSAELSMIPKNTINLDEKAAVQVLKLLDRLEQMDEVQGVSSNADFPDTILESY
jgi:YebC/PmpR family DNA-binding regulatory protein